MYQGRFRLACLQGLEVDIMLRVLKEFVVTWEKKVELWIRPYVYCMDYEDVSKIWVFCVFYVVVILSVFLIVCW